MPNFNSTSEPNSPRSPKRIHTAPIMKKRPDYGAKHDTGSGSPRPPSEGGAPSKPKNLILEHWKIQDGRVLDLAVLKEPFEDRFSILGIDVDDGQRYQLSLSSEEVANILEGDILVTSFDSAEVWVALVEKVNLKPVGAFIKPGAPTMKPGSAPVNGSPRKIKETNSDKNKDVSHGSLGGSSTQNFQQEYPQVSSDPVSASASREYNSQEETDISKEWGSLLNASSLAVDTNYDDEFEGADDNKGLNQGRPVMTEDMTHHPLSDERGMDVPANREERKLESLISPEYIDRELSVKLSEAFQNIHLSAASKVEAGSVETNVPISENSAASVDLPLPTLSRPVSFQTDISLEVSRPNTGRGLGNRPQSSSRGRQRPLTGDGTRPSSSIPLSPNKSDYSVSRPNAPEATPPSDGRRSAGVAPVRRNIMDPNSKPKTPDPIIAKSVAKSKLPVDDRPLWGSNALMTKVHEKMVEDEKKAVLAKGQDSSIDNSVDTQSTKDASSVNINPNPPNVPRPSVPERDKGKQFKSIKGRRSTEFVKKENISQNDNDEN